MARSPARHREFLATSFEPQVKIDAYPEEEQKLLLKYGSWLKALMLEQVEPVTEPQKQFIEMCNGKRRPQTELELLWYKYQIDLMYLIAKQCEYHIGNRFSYQEVEAMFKKLALQGHPEALRWSKGWKLPVNHRPPLVNIKKIYPKNLYESNDIYAWQRLPGNPGSRR